MTDQAHPEAGGSDEDSSDRDDVDSLETPTLVYTANGNLEAHSAVTWLRYNGIRAFAVEDNSGASLFVFGTISQFHKPQVFVEKQELRNARDLLRQFETQRSQRRRDHEDQSPIEAECEECGAVSEFPASQDGTTQNCPKCNAYMDVGSTGFPDDFDFGEVDQAPARELTVDEALDAAAQLDSEGDWDEAINAFREIATRWPEHATYASNSIAAIQAKIDAAKG